VAGGSSGETQLIDRSDILRRFEELVDAALAPEAPPPGIPAELLSESESPAEGTDLYSMWSVLTALTQEVKLQGRAFKQLSDTLSRGNERDSRKSALNAVLDLRERLLRGLESVSAVEEPRPGFLDRVFPARWGRMRHLFETVRALGDGYRMSLASLDDLLAQWNVRPIDCKGQLFSPLTMNAIELDESGGAPDGTVLAVYRTGYEWNGEVFRPAQVRVSRARGMR
jgi:molecular chaperone GrpE